MRANPSRKQKNTPVKLMAKISAHIWLEVFSRGALSAIPALAITIHKSQGSESNNVNVLWKQNFNNSNLYNANKSEILLKNNFEKRLFYTAITRAKKNLKIYYLNT